MASVSIKFSGNGRQIVLNINQSSNTWDTPNPGKLCVDGGAWTSAVLGPSSLEVTLDDGNSKPVVELHDFSFTANANGRAALRCGGSLPSDSPDDPVGNYNWEVIAIQ
jgi:hypothetical protein